MSARYQVLQHEKKPYWLTNCPLLMVTHALTKDTSNNTIFLQCKFQNLNGVKIFEFDGNTLTYDYWEEMEGYRYNKTQLVSDINEILN